MHSWGDEGVDWEGIEAAAAYIGLGLRRWGRIDVPQFKEKWGTVRVYCYLGFRMLHQVIWPGYVANQYPWKWMWRLDIRLSKLWSFVNKVATPYHKWLYRRYYKAAVRKWPHLQDEILSGADYPEILGPEAEKFWTKV